MYHTGLILNLYLHLRKLTGTYFYFALYLLEPCNACLNHMSTLYYMLEPYSLNKWIDESSRLGINRSFVISYIYNFAEFFVVLIIV